MKDHFFLHMRDNPSVSFVTVNSKEHRLILLADQPHEALFLGPIGNCLLKLNKQITLSLAFTDYYTFLSRTDFLDGFKGGFSGEVFHLGDTYKGWQNQIENPEVDFDFLDNWEKENCAERTLSEIERTNQLVYADERAQWHFPISEIWKKKILIDTILWCEAYLARFQPTALISVGNATLTTNILYTLAKKRGLPFFTFFPSRIGTRILLREDFAYGMSDKLYGEILVLSENASLRQSASILADSIVRKRRGTYDSFEAKIAKDFQLKRKLLLHSATSDVRRFLGRMYARIFIHRRQYAFKVIRVNENFIKMSFFDIRRLVIEYLRQIGIFNCGRKTIPTEKYILWALHIRPEGSVSTLGDGRDEIEELLRCANLLPDDCFIAVKENPEMFGLRERGFHRKLKANKKIILIDPFTPIFPLIESSLGVIGISGTVLLEAAIMNKFTCSLGHPEFDRFLTFAGWSKAKTFIEMCVSNLQPDSLNRILPYLCYVIQSTNETDMPPWYDDYDEIRVKEMHNRLAQMLLDRLEGN